MFLVLPLLSLSPYAPVPADREARAIVEKAVAARGGEAVLVRPVRYRSKGWEASFTSGGRYDYDTETIERLPGERKSVASYSHGGRGRTIVWLWSGGRAWKVENGLRRELTGPVVQYHRQWLHARHAQSLAPLLKGGYTLTPLGMGRVKDAPAVGVRAAAPGYEDVDLWFDPGTGLLAKVAYRSVHPVRGYPVGREVFLSDYRDWGGRKVAARGASFRDGVQVFETEVYEFRVLDAVDDAEFDPAAMPGVPFNALLTGLAVVVTLVAARVWLRSGKGTLGSRP